MRPLHSDHSKKSLIPTQKRSPSSSAARNGESRSAAIFGANDLIRQNENGISVTARQRLIYGRGIRAEDQVCKAYSYYKVCCAIVGMHMASLRILKGSKTGQTARRCGRATGRRRAQKICGCRMNLLRSLVFRNGGMISHRPPLPLPLFPPRRQHNHMSDQ